MVTSYFRAAHGVLVVYDVTNENSYLSVSRWIRRVNDLKPDIPMAVVANKVDLEAVVSASEARLFCADKGLDFFELSALNGQGVQDSFVKFVTRMSEARKLEPVKPTTTGGVQIDKKASVGGKTGWC